MHGVLTALVAAEEIDPATVRPSPLGAIVSAFLLTSLVLLVWSFIRHLRRAQTNLGSARLAPASQTTAPQSADPDPVEATHEETPESRDAQPHELSTTDGGKAWPSHTLISPADPRPVD
jgi:hypothetical protein